MIVAPRFVLFVVGAVALLSGCSHTRAFERGKLAHPSMTTAAAVGPAEAHLYSTQEGATGGEASAEAGCGCN